MVPLSEKMRPQNLSEVIGQDEFVKTLEKIIQTGRPLSLLLYGPPGSGKTTMARLYASQFSLPFLQISGVFNSTAELKKMLKEGQETPLFQRQTILFVDEIHRFNRAQQDLFLPFLEEGTLILIGATTENPSYVLNNALLSRLRLLKLEPLEPKALHRLIDRYESLVKPLSLSAEERETLVSHAQGDGRHLFNLIENIEQDLPIPKKPPLYDRHQDWHYNFISALHKSVRGSDPDAALYWLARMLEGGEEPLYIARRLIRMASEDVGLADPQALTIALQAYQVYETLGSPEGELALAQATLYLALSPKSNASYTAYTQAREIAQGKGHLEPPKEIQHEAQGYIYDPDTPYGFSGQNYFPPLLGRCEFYHPVERGFEREMKKRIDYFRRLREKIGNTVS